MKKIIPVMLALAFLAIAPFAVTADDAATATGQVDMEAARVTFETTCSKCHDLQRPLARSKDLETWEKTVGRMSEYYKRFGALIPEEDQKAIVQYLVENAGK